MAAETKIVGGTTIARHGHAVLLRGPSGRGKSDLALRAICQPVMLPGEPAAQPFVLVSDDQTTLTLDDGEVLTSAPAPLRGLLEVRDIGIVQVPYEEALPLVLVVDLTCDEIERMPDYPGAHEMLLGCRVDRIDLAPFEASAPAKVALALERSRCDRTSNDR